VCGCVVLDVLVFVCVVFCECGSVGEGVCKGVRAGMVVWVCVIVGVCV
jgi:hypothetical protein